jgi:tRNA threonylcarbamoyladenosine biosynthesis protein TsaE
VTRILTGTAVDFISHSAEQTQRVGERLGRMLQPGDLVCLEGNLGSGKTCLAQGIGRGLGVTTAVSSPTFIIANEYRLPGRRYRFYHIDLYRVETIAEARATGLEEYFFSDGVCVIEWAERVRELLPPDRLWITLYHLDHSKRELRFEAVGERYEQLLGQFRQDAFGA